MQQAAQGKQTHTRSNSDEVLLLALDYLFKTILPFPPRAAVIGACTARP